MKRTIQLSDLYDADRRTTDPAALRVASERLIPHPFRNVQYGDGLVPCTHAKKHRPGQLCAWPTAVRP